MKKNLLIVAVIAIFAGIFSACDPIEPTDTDLLTQTKGWKLSAATSSPAYEFSDGTFASDLIKDGYLYDCELDDIIYFRANGGMDINLGEVCEEDGAAEYASQWTLKEENGKKTLEFDIPFFHDPDVREYADVLELTKEQLRVKFTFSDDEAPAKGTYSFTLTYVPAK